MERIYHMAEIEDAAREGRLTKAFVSGTAYFITSVSHIHFRGKEISIPMRKGSTGEYADLVKRWLKDIMYGTVNHEWGVVADEQQ